MEEVQSRRRARVARVCAALKEEGKSERTMAASGTWRNYTFFVAAPRHKVGYCSNPKVRR